MSATLRPARISDAIAIAALTRELGYPVEDEVMRARLASMLAREDQRIVVAELDGDVVGWLQVIANEALESGFRAEIVGLVVAARARRRGLGQQLVVNAERWARERGAPALVVRSNLQRIESHAFYLALGYTHTKSQAVYRKPLESGAGEHR